MWASIGLIFTAFIVTAGRTQAVYASFAIAIVTLMWLYANWMVLLIGAQIAFYVQNPAYLRHGRQEPRLSNSMRERLALNIMYLVGRAYREPGQEITIASLSDALKIPSLTLAPIISWLESGEMLRSNENEQLVPGYEMARMRLADIIAVVRSQGETGAHVGPAWSSVVEGLGSELDAAISERVGDKTLADLLDAATSESPGPTLISEAR